MKSDTTGTEHSTLTQVVNWWHETRKYLRQLNELSQLPPAELERVAADMGLTCDELMRVARQPDATSLLIEKRLAVLNLDREDISKLTPLLLRDLERTCALCSEKSRCAHDLAEDPLSVAWEHYCPNSSTLRSLT
jgi:uncharacterized protein YjiS (DUF1127 family)